VSKGLAQRILATLALSASPACKAGYSKVPKAKIATPLPGRRNIVVTRQAGLQAPGAEVVTSLEAALALCTGAGSVFVIGGAQIYAEALPRADCVEMTEIDADFEGDAVMPPLDAAQWQETQRVAHGPSAERPFAYAFVTYRRR
jgi:dihydrofolate reductase